MSECNGSELVGTVFRSPQGAILVRATCDKRFIRVWPDGTVESTWGGYTEETEPYCIDDEWR